MRYLIKPKDRRYVKGNSYLSFAKRFGNKYDKKIMGSATKTGSTNVAKTASKRVAQKQQKFQVIWLEIR